MVTGDTRQMIMEAARATVQLHGYNGLSFREVAKEVGVKSASIHYHFPTKGDLAQALAQRYTEELVSYLDGLLSEAPDVRDCIQNYANVFRGTMLKDNRMCLGGILAAELADLPPEVQAEVKKFAEANVAWLVKVLSLPAAGKSKSALGKAEAQCRALAIFAGVEGAQLVARSHGDVAIYDQIIAAYRATGLFL